MKFDQDSENDSGWLSLSGYDRLRRRIERVLRSGPRGRPTIASVTEPLAGEHDPSGIVLTAKAKNEWFMVLDQPERGERSLAMLGVASQLAGAGSGRFAALQREWDELCAHALADAAHGGAGAGLCAAVGFAFSERGAASDEWRGFPNAALTVPRVSVARDQDGCWVTVNVAVEGGTDVDAVLAEIGRTLERLAAASLMLGSEGGAGDGRRVAGEPGAVSVSELTSGREYERIVKAATELIGAGEIEKIVLARDVRVERVGDAFEPAAVLGSLRERFPACFVYGAGFGDAAFVGATPELLVRLEGHRASTVALAGSIRRGADPEEDRRLGETLLASAKDVHENRIVARRIVRALEPLSVWVSQAEEPMLVAVANIQHLCIPIRAQLTREAGILRLVGALHPTPAVGGEPTAAAVAEIARLEGFDRGWYAGALGWTDLNGDGEFCVGLRCALLRGAQARCFAGAGIVADSDPASELAETETKLAAILPSLGVKSG